MPDNRPDTPGSAPSDGSGAVRDVVILCLIAAVLRFWAFADLGISHYDEGGYAMSAQALARGEPAAMYQLQHFLSPPFFFGSAGLLARLSGLAPDRALLLVSAAFGVLTVALVYGATRHWFGRAAGGAAALVIALSDFHILLSRVGLTDVTFAAWFVAAVWLYSLAETRRSVGFAALAGLATGLAWNTKYHGWLAGIVAAGAVLPGLLRANRAEWRGTIVRLGVAALVAAALYLPWFLYVQGQEGGYARLTQEHRSFLQPARFARAALVHVREQLGMDGWPSRLAPALAFLWCGVVLRARSSVLAPWIVALMLAGIAAGESLTVGLLASAGATLLLARHRLTGGSHWYPVFFFAGFTVLSPLYRPYARLLLPWVIAAAILAGPALAAIAAREATSGLRRFLAPGVIAAAALAVIAITGVRPPAPTWAPTDGLRRASGMVDVLTPGGQPVGVFGEPGVVAYLRQRGRDAWALNEVTELGQHVQPGQEAWLVGGVYSRRARGPRSMHGWLETHPSARTAEIPVHHLNAVRLLDDFSPQQAREFLNQPTGAYALRIYRITWPSQ